MNDSEKFKQTVLGMKDEELKSFILQASKAAGGNGEKAARLASDVQAVKRIIEAMSENEAREMFEKAGRGKINEVFDKLGGK